MRRKRGKETVNEKKKTKKERKTHVGTGAEGGDCSEQPAMTRQNPAAKPPAETRASTEPRSRSRSGRRGAADAAAAGAGSGKGGILVNVLFLIMKRRKNRFVSFFFSFFLYFLSLPPLVCPLHRASFSFFKSLFLPLSHSLLQKEENNKKSFLSLLLSLSNSEKRTRVSLSLFRERASNEPPSLPLSNCSAGERIRYRKKREKGKRSKKTKGDEKKKKLQKFFYAFFVCSRALAISTFSLSLKKEKRSSPRRRGTRPVFDQYEKRERGREVEL